MIDIVNISKSFGKKGEIIALQDINLHVNKGQIFGLIGPDGAGKTTLFRILTTLILPNNGKARVAGYDIIDDFKKIRKIVGYMPGKFSLYQDLTVGENLEFYASIFNTTIEENYHLIKDIYIQLEPFKDRRAGALSGGMKQKLALCCSLIHKPEVLFLDEPTTGVDVVSRKEFWEMLARLKYEGITIFVSTPYMDEASLCDQVALIQNGKILSCDTPKGLIENFGKDLFGIKTENLNEARKLLAVMPKVSDVYASGEFLHLTAPKGKLKDSDIIPYLEHYQFKEIQVIKAAVTIEDCFLDLMHTS